MRLILLLKQWLFCSHQWRADGGTFMGAEKVCTKCGLWDSMTGKWYGHDFVRTSKEKKNASSHT